MRALDGGLCPRTRLRASTRITYALARDNQSDQPAGPRLSPNHDLDVLVRSAVKRFIQTFDGKTRQLVVTEGETFGCVTPAPWRIALRAACSRQAPDSAHRPGAAWLDVGGIGKPEIREHVPVPRVTFSPFSALLPYVSRDPSPLFSISSDQIDIPFGCPDADGDFSGTRGERTGLLEPNRVNGAIRVSVVRLDDLQYARTSPFTASPSSGPTELRNTEGVSHVFLTATGKLKKSRLEDPTQCSGSVRSQDTSHHRLSQFWDSPSKRVLLIVYGGSRRT